jgi:hypothetical protein
MVTTWVRSFWSYKTTVKTTVGLKTSDSPVRSTLEPYEQGLSAKIGAAPGFETICRTINDK